MRLRRHKPESDAPADPAVARSRETGGEHNPGYPELIIAGRATPSLLVSHELPLTEAPAAYERFDERADGYTKVILHPAAA